MKGMTLVPKSRSKKMISEYNQRVRVNYKNIYIRNYSNRIDSIKSYRVNNGNFYFSNNLIF